MTKVANTSIKVGILISFDWELIKNSLPLIYEDADLITLAIDKSRKTWTGKQFDLPPSFFEYIQSVDKKGKIKLYEEDFFLFNSTPMEIEVHTRNRIASFMGEGGWHLQLDVDEYFLAFADFVKFLRSKNPSQMKPVNITCGWITLFKRLDYGYLIISHHKNKPSLIPIATNKPDYKYGRMNGNYNLFSGYYMIHDSWARNEIDLWKKLSNWGHKDDFNINEFFNFWKGLDETNYKNPKDFHPIQPTAWKSLKYIKGDNLAMAISNFLMENKNFIRHSSFDLFLRNSKVINKIKSFLK